MQRRAAYLGPPGTYSHQVAVNEFEGKADLIAFKTISDVFVAIINQDCHVGLVPLSNSSNGPQTKQINMEIRHCLMRADNATTNPILRIVSHEQALGQCKNYLSQHYSAAMRTEVDSTAAAALEASKDSNLAAICSKAAGEIYNLVVIDAGPNGQGIQDAGLLNITTFAVIKRR